MSKPTFDEWSENPTSNYFCDAVVLRKDGETQTIKDCTFNYSFDGEREIVMKKGWLVKDYFFVDEVKHFINHRREAML